MKTDEPVRAMLIPLTSGSGETGIALVDIGFAIRKRLNWLIVLGVLLVVVVFIVYGTAERKYRASTTFILASQSSPASSLGSLGSSLGSLASIAGLSLTDPAGFREEALATLQSRSLIRDFILDNDLRQVLFADQWSESDESWTSSDGLPPSDDRAVRYFRDNLLAVDRDPGANVIKLSITWTNPSQAANWANEIVERVDERLRSRARREAEKSLEFLGSELGRSVNTEMQRAAYALIEQNMTTIMMTNVRPDFAFRIIDFATAPQDDEPYWPKLTYLIAAAGFMWILAGCIIVLVEAVARDHKERAKD